MRARGYLLIVLLALGGVGGALALPGRGGAVGPCPAPRVWVGKSRGEVHLYCGARLARRFAATFGAQPLGPKLQEGDERTPEGEYQISSRVVTPRFHRFLGVSYPNEQDRRRAREAGVTRLGGGIGIHGSRHPRAARLWTRVATATGLHRLWGPTDGCVALTNEDIEALYEAVPVGAKVTIVP